MKKLLIIARYTIYNLPDTEIFANGNKIINHYNASGNKWKTEYHTIIDAMYLPNTADGTVFEGNLADIHYTIYDGNIEYKYIVNSMGVGSLYEYVIHNTEGYIAYHPQNNTMMHYYYHQDHLGNICAVWVDSVLCQWITTRSIGDRIDKSIIEW